MLWLCLCVTVKMQWMKSVLLTMTWIKEWKIHLMLNCIIYVFTAHLNAESRMRRIFMILRILSVRGYIASQIDRTEWESKDITVFWFRSDQMIL